MYTCTYTKLHDYVYVCSYIRTYVCNHIKFCVTLQQVQYFNLTVTPCPPGHVLHSTDEEDEFECQCNDDNDQGIVNCLPEQNKIVLKVRVMFSVH